MNGADSNGGRGGHTKCMGGASIAALRGTPIAAVYGAQLSLQSENAGYGTQTPAHDLALKKKREDATKSQPRASPCGQTPGPRLIPLRSLGRRLALLGGDTAVVTGELNSSKVPWPPTEITASRRFGKHHEVGIPAAAGASLNIERSS